MPTPPVLPDLTVRQLEYLVAVDGSPTWADAAASVGVSASALSQGLAELERRIGVPLFDREGRRRVLRPAAEPVLDHARRVVAMSADLARWADRAASGDTGRLRLGMIDAAAVAHYPEVLRSFMAARPDLDVHLRVAPSGELLAELAVGGLDLVVCVDPPLSPAGVDVEALTEEDLAVYAPGGRRPRDPSRWGPWVLFPPDSHTRSVIVEALAGVGATIDVVAESHQPEVLREMVALGLGWTVLPVVQAEAGERPLRHGRRLARRRLVAATRAGAATHPAVASLRDVLRS